MTPLIDMMFLLLIFLLLAAKFRPQEDFLPFQLPAVPSLHQTMVKPEPLIIHISATHSGCLVQISQLYAVRIEDENSFTDIPPLWAEKLNSLKHLCRSNLSTGK
jgi:biopolymer transport protein ExbD